MTKSKQDKPQAGKIYSLTGAPGEACIANGNTWADSEFKETKKINKAPNGWPADKPWTEETAKEAMEVAGLGLSRSDFSDDGADLEELKEIMEGGI